MSIACPPAFQRDPGQAARMIVVCGSEAHVFSAGEPIERNLYCHLVRIPLVETEPTVTGLLRLCELFKADQVWLLPRIGRNPTDADTLLVRDWAQLRLPPVMESLVPGLAARWSLHALTARGGSHGAAQLGGIVAQRIGPDGRGAGPILRIHAPWVQDAWALGPLLERGDTPADRCHLVAAAFRLAMWTLGQQLRFSPSYAGITLFRGTLLHKWHQVDFSPLSERWVQFLLEHRAHPVMWRRHLETSGPVQLRKYDRNSAYVTAAREVPVGEPVGTFGFVPGVCGLYQVQAWPPMGWPALTPGPFYEGSGTGRYPDFVSGVWAWEPQIRLALRHGWGVEVSGGFYWPKAQTHDLFRDWQERIWTARRECAAAVLHHGIVATVAESLVKRIGVSTIGRLLQVSGRAVRSEDDAEALGLPVLSYEVDNAGEYTGWAEVREDLGRADLLRPDWWSCIIAAANERLQHACYAVAPQDTVALYVDSLYTLHEHAELAGDRLKAGGFRHAATAELPAAVLASGTPGELARHFASADD